METNYTELITYLKDKLLPSLTYTDAAHNIDHFYRVTRNAMIIADGQGNLNAIQVACLLHDIVNYPKNHPDRKKSAQKSAERAAEILTSKNCAPDFIELVQECIACHSYSSYMAGNLRSKTMSWEAECVQDADRLDSLGMIGIARCLYISGILGGFIMHETDPLGKDRELDDSQYALDHFQVKLGHLQYLINTPKAKSIARKRSVLMEEFRHRLAAGDEEAKIVAEYFYQRGCQKLSLYSNDDFTSMVKTNHYIQKFIQETSIKVSN